MKLARKKFEVSIPTMAMGDIAFLLLIFFVILARVTDDSHVKWEPAHVQKIERAGYALASVAIDENNVTFLDGQRIGHGQIAAALKERIKNAPVGHRTILLKVHKDATASYFQPVIEAISEAGGELVHVLEEDKKTK